MHLVSPGANTTDSSYVQRYLSSTFGISFIYEPCVCGHLNSESETPAEEEEGDCNDRTCEGQRRWNTTEREGNAVSRRVKTWP